MHMDSSAGPAIPFAQSITPTTSPEQAGRPSSDTGRDADDGCFPPQTAILIAENHELRAEIERLRSERSRIADIQARLMEVLGCKSADRLVHDVRNVLNERELYRALADTIPD